MHFYHILLPEKYCLQVGPLTYASEEDIVPGFLVRVPFRNNEMLGLVIERTAPITDEDFKVKEVAAIEKPALSAAQIKLSKWLADYYAVPLLKSVLLFLPKEQWKIPKRKFKVLSSKFKVETHTQHEKPILTEEQNRIVEKILDENEKVWLLHGVTGSGKTEIYLRVAEEVLKRGGQVIILVPEIALTPQTLARIEERFPGQIAVIHSGITPAQKRNMYDEIRNGTKNVVLGARSALFAPAHNLGLIIVDEEHEGSYHQDQSPRYHAVTVARELQKTTGSILILGSATPGIVSYGDPKQEIVHLPSRVASTMPNIELVDMRDELKARNFSPLSERLKEAIEHELHEKRQVMLFLNRRGFATSYLCRECGHREMCPHCEISLTVHLEYNRSFDPTAKLICHYCDYTKEPPTSCPKCGGVTLKALGSGTQKILVELENLFPHARTIRVDGDTMTSPEKYRAFYHDFLNHKYDIVLGTQMIAKGLHLPKVNLVGVILADLSFHFPEYTAQEKTFQILTQVAGRSGRGNEQGRVIIQTYDPTYAVLRHVVNHDYEAFKKEELGFRQEFWYPPFCDLIRLTVYRPGSNEARDAANSTKVLLENQKISLGLEMEIFGPTPTWMHRRVGKFGYHILLKVPKGRDIISHLITFLPRDIAIDRE